MERTRGINKFVFDIKFDPLGEMKETITEYLYADTWSEMVMILRLRGPDYIYENNIRNV